jgi:hypothetical protein
MARIETDPNYTAPTFSRATAATDLFKKEDIQQLAAAFSGHVHDGNGKGLAVPLPPAGSITGGMIADGSIGTADLADGAVTNAKLGPNSVLSANIADGTITGADIAAGTITGTNIADGTITGADIAAGTITSAHIADGTIVTADIADNQITSAKITDGSIATVDLADGLITAAKLSSADTFAMAGLHVTGTATLDASVNMPSGCVIANGTGGQVSIGTTPFSSYRLTLANLASPAGQGIAQSWVTYACVDHALAASLNVAPIDDPLGKVRAIPAYYYPHMAIDADGNPVEPLETAQTYGFSATEVAAVIPELADASNSTVDYGRLMTVLWAACQQLDARLSALEA